MRPAKALKIRSDHAAAYNNIAADYGKMGRWDDADRKSEGHCTRWPILSPGFGEG